MAFKSLHAVLGGVQHQYQRQEYRELRQVMNCWAEVVGPVVAAQTRPLNLYRGVLKVATSSAAWSQNLVFERQRILDKLNRAASLQITDIRFSPGQWRSTSSQAVPGADYQQELWQAHPSRLSDAPRKKSATSITGERTGGMDAIAAFQQWKQTMRSRQLPLCPECQCPTPTGELDRWRMCGICAAKRW